MEAISPPASPCVRSVAEALTRYQDGMLELLDSGGTAMPLLVFVAWLMWVLITWRALVVLPGSAADVHVLWKRSELRGRGVLVEAVRRVRAGMSSLDGLPGELKAEWVRLVVAEEHIRVGSNRSLVVGLVMSAPLLGLLGTVSGMIETFDALGQAALFRQSGGIAGGISEALLTTQVGLFIAIPGTLASRFVDGRETRIHRGLEELEVLVQAPLEQVA